LSTQFRTLSALLVFLALTSPTQTHAQEIWRGDGSWWMAQSKEARASYLVGVMDGLALQERMVLRSHIDVEDDPSKIKQRHSESMAAPRRLLRNLNSNQVRDGLDVFYADYRNRHITVPSAMQIVVYQIKAEPQALIDSLLESMRRLGE
jgi:hypothetical protein